MSDGCKIECLLPDDPKTIAFLRLTDRDRMRAIDLGMRFLSSGNDQLQFWNSEAWEKKLILVRERKDKELAVLQEDLRTARERSTVLLKRQADEQRLIFAQTRQDSEAKYKEHIHLLESKLHRTDKQLVDLIHDQGTLLEHTHAKCQNTLDAKQLHWEQRLDALRIHYEEQLATEKERTREYWRRENNSTIKGQIGENFTIYELTRRFPRAEFEDTSKENGRGDFIMKDDSFVMLIETKNYKNNVTRPEIIKFYRDVDNSQDIQCAVLLSLRSGICAKDDFHLEVRQGKPILFLHNVSQNMANIPIAVQLFKLILNVDTIDLTNKESLEKMRNHIPTLKRNWSKIRQKMSRFQTDVLDCLLSQENIVKNIFDIVDLKY